MVKAEIISVGTELLLGQIVNTNAQFLALQMAELGIGLYFQTVVGDNEMRLMEAVHQALARADVLIITGGLGPTEDDITRETVAKAFAKDLVYVPEIEAELQRIFSGREMPANNLRQAYLPRGAVVLPNPHGTAPGLALKHHLGQLIFLLPGPPREMQPMFRNFVIPYLQEQGMLNGRVISRTLHFVGIGESKVAEVLSDLISNQSVPTIALYSKLGEVDVRLTAHTTGVAAADSLFSPVRAAILARLQPYFYGEDECTLARAVGEALGSRGHLLAVAESCTGGMIGHLITNESGSSAYFLGSLVCYANEVKTQLLGVQEATLEQFGAVSEECAREMLRGALRLKNATVGLAVTGIAGPLGGTAEKPVGTVWLAAGCRSVVKTKQLSLTGDREAIKERAARLALALLLNLLREGK